jgi:hypothetical protein
MKTKKIIDATLEWGESKIVIHKESASLTLSQREVVSLFIILREILGEWKSSQKL